MFTAAACLVLCGALPTISTPELLVDIDESPSTAGELIGANPKGMLLDGLNDDGSRSLWWMPWDGEPFLVIDQSQGVTSATLGDGFILFTADGAGQVRVSNLALGDQPHLDVLATVPGPVRIIDSSSHVWWVAPNGTSTTDGTPAGTRLVAPGLAAEFQAGESLYPFGFRDAGVSLRSFKRAGVHAVAADTSLYNELGERLIESTNCVAHAGGDVAWVSCMGDGGVVLHSTDGTPGGTRARLGPAGNFFHYVDDAVSSDYYVVPRSPSGGGGCTLVTAMDGPLVPVELCGWGRIFGDVWVNEHSVSALAPPFTKLEMGALHDVRAAGRRAVFETSADYRLTDGTQAGTRVVPSQWPQSLVTASASPRLISSNGDRALYGTTRGVWVTDGTRAGTLRVGESAVFWNKRVLATQENALVVFDADGKSWVPPTGTLGVAHTTLIGQDGCKLFSVDDDRRQQTTALEGCVATVSPGPDGALIKTDLGSYFLVRDGRAIELGQDISADEGFRCGDERCWFLGNSNTVISVDLKNGTISLIAQPNASVAMLGASSLAVLLVDKSNGSRRVVFKNSVQVNIADDALTLFLSDGRLALLESHGINLLSDGASPAPSLLAFECPRPTGLSMTGKTLHALCGDTLRSGPVEGPLAEVEAGLVPKLPEGDVLAWSSIVREDQSLVRVTSGNETREFPGLRGSNFARVREGFVFAGIGATPDEELWVVKTPPAPGCGCGAGGGESVLWLALVAILGRVRRSVRT